MGCEHFHQLMELYQVIKIPFGRLPALAVERNESAQGHPCPLSPRGGAFLNGTPQPPR
jgi:hypothetical protein